MAKKELTYSEALNRIAKIVENIESNELDIDELNASVKEAASLIEACKTKLQNAETNLQETLDKLA